MFTMGIFFAGGRCGKGDKCPAFDSSMDGLRRGKISIARCVRASRSYPLSSRTHSSSVGLTSVPQSEDSATLRVLPFSLECDDICTAVRGCGRGEAVA